MTVDIRKRKADLRRSFIAQRLTLPEADRRRAAQDLVQAFFSHITLGEREVIAGYIPLRGEIDPMPLLRELERRGHAIALPKVAEDSLSFLSWRCGDPLTRDAFGTQVPMLGTDTVPTMALVPLVAFDSTRGRLGYGGGYYDRALHALERNTGFRSVGLAYAFQKCDDLPLEPHDAALSAVVTDAGPV